MENKKLNSGLLIIAFVLILGFVGTAAVGAFTDFNVGTGIAFAAELICGLAAFSYFVKGYKKDCAKYYRIAFLVIAGSYFIDAFADSILHESSGVWLAFTLILYGNNLILGVAKDLGKIPSFCLGAFNAIAYIAILIVDIVSVAGISSIMFSISWATSAIVGLIMIAAKYTDKENRQSK